MMIAIDIGNTNTGIALLSGRGNSRVVRTDSVKTGLRGCYEKRLSKALRAIVQDIRAPRHQGTSRRKIAKTKDASRLTIDEIIICSVVPNALMIAKTCVKKVFKTSPKIIGKDIIVPIKNRYKDPSQVGQDRLVSAYSASQIYGTPAVVVDLGTAMTFDVIGGRFIKGVQQPEYLGGMIVPGIRLSAEALYDKTALLPKIDIHKPKTLVGKTTEESILCGLFYGYGEMIKGIISLLTEQFHQKPNVIVTGGYSDLMKHYVSDYRCIVEKDLIYKGMALLT